MRKLILILNILILSHVCYAQDILDPEPLTFSIYGQQQRLSPELLGDTTFILGWHWGGSRKMTETMNTNVIISF